MEAPFTDPWQRFKAALRERITGEDAEAWLTNLRLDSIQPDKVVVGGLPNTYLKNRVIAHFLPVFQELLPLYFDVLPKNGTFGLECRLAAGKQTIPPPTQNNTGGGEVDPPTGKYTFDHFKAGPASRVALDLARKVAEEPGMAYNPLFIVGGEGLGKTHLLQAIAGQIQAAHPEWKVIYKKSETFANEILEAIQTRKMKPVREFYRQADALLLDDVEFLRVTAKTQDELIHTLDDLIANKKQLVFSAGLYPKEMASLKETLKARFEMGLMTELGDPDLATRVDILKHKAALDGMTLPEEGFGLLAERIDSTPRQLEGALVRLEAYGSMMNQPITLDFIREVAAPYFTKPGGDNQNRLSADAILAGACDLLGVSMKALQGRSRTARIAEARKITMYLLKELGGLSFSDIGRMMGHRTHSTVIHAVSQWQKAMVGNTAVHNQTTRLKKQILQGGAK
ncbi:MAG: chromosomal replication initiator protein DnaA [Deltaproteobacteria bacterium]|nr:chromosomal replication initiator protein DnaA [Deltaproteobacteria bacterium]